MPAKYGDLGKKGNDLFAKGFEHGKYKLEVVSKHKCCEITTKGHQDISSGNISTSHEMKMKMCKNKGTLKTTVDPSKDVVTCDYENTSIDNLKVNALFNLAVNEISCPAFKELKLNYTHEKANVNLNSDLANNVGLDAVFALPENFNLGLKLAMSMKSLDFKSREMAISGNFGTMDYTMKTSFNNDFGWVLHNNISPRINLAHSITMNSSGTQLALAGKIAGCCGSFNQFKVASNGRFALSHITPLRADGVTLTISGEFDAMNLNSGNHKIGAGLKFEL